MPRPDDARLGLYIHIPFCSVKCYYCDFTAFALRRAQTARYLRALEAEARLRPRPEIDTLYIGGGTPSELSPGELEELLGAVSSVYGPPERFIEATVEANPGSLSADKLEILARGGVGRLSLGLQTAEPRLLREIGRRHTYDDFLRVYKDARRLGFSIGVDLMYGLPAQAMGEHLASLEAVLALRPDHLSLYGLQVEDHTLFAKRGVAHDEDLGREMFERALDRLAAAGYRHYEIANFALPGRESVHNSNYWRDGEYLGLGCGASGHLGGARYANLDRLSDYCGAVEGGRLPTASSEALSGRRKLGETVWLGLRLLEGVALTPAVAQAFPEEIGRLRGRNWLEEAPGRIRLTREGVFFANRVFEEFMAADGP